MMNRDEALEYVSKYVWWPKPDALSDSLPHAPADWEWVNDKVGATGKALFNPIYGTITVNDWTTVRSNTVPTPAATTRDEALRYTMNYVRWPEYDTVVSALPNIPVGWDWVIQFDEYVLVHSIHDPITRADWERARSNLTPVAVTPTPTPNKYQRTVPSTTIDVYDVLHAYNVTNPATQHAVKKLLQPGNRGHKDTLTDLREALVSIQRAIQIEEQSQ